MPRKGKLEDLTAEELLDLAEKAISGDISKDSGLTFDKSNVLSYIRERKIKAGTTLVHTDLIYVDYYENWKPWGNKLGKTAFFRKFSKEFESHRTKSGRYYKLEESELFNTSKESVKKAKFYVKRSVTIKKALKEKIEKQETLGLPCPEKGS